MDEKNFDSEQPGKPEELLSEKEYIARGKRLYRLVNEVISNRYTYNPEKEKELLELKEIFSNLYQARVKSAQEAEWDLAKKNLLDFDPVEKITEAQEEYRQSEGTLKDDEKRMAKVYFAIPDWAATKADEAYGLIQTRGLNRPRNPLSPPGTRLSLPLREGPSPPSASSDWEEKPPPIHPPDDKNKNGFGEN